ncbi:MAG TPA: DmsC/YnfH family molybdoenzyme membrane anchor subunit [Acidobacteriaceae bacterium]|nr:DmsC/YnfH family molybdoenzyme membrane anchor subunit [Acidobacteriaceae bacterium]
MALPLHERAQDGSSDTLVRLTLDDFLKPLASAPAALPPVAPMLVPGRPLEPGEQYRFHFNMTKCIGCRSCEIACNEQNGNPTEIRWRRVGEIEGGTYPETSRHYLSMGCNHCLDADCLKGCPVDAYTKDPVTGIVLHSADACIGCQYCVWNCPYSVPQFNEERGVVGKCDMCHGRLTDGLEPACVNACPEGAIEIEIVDMLAWRSDYALAESPGMPAAGHTISTTRITLPPDTATKLERVDAGRIAPEHAHLSLVFMTTLMQAVTGSLAAALFFHATRPLLLVALLGITAVALNISVFHLGRPAYAWRALKMWRRSWLSREVLLFGLFFAALAGFTAATCLDALPSIWLGRLHLSRMVWLQHMPATTPAILTLGIIAAGLGIAGIIASSFIYLVPARPSWNMVHTPIDFLLSAALIGVTLPAVLRTMLAPLLPAPSRPVVFPLWLVALASLLWIANHGARLIRLNQSAIFEHRAAAALLNLPGHRAGLIGSFACATAVPLAWAASHSALACAAALSAVLLARYLFFVSVVPLNMALTFTRGGTH